MPVDVHLPLLFLSVVPFHLNALGLSLGLGLVKILGYNPNHNPTYDSSEVLVQISIKDATPLSCFAPRVRQALEKLESVPDFGTLDWRGTAEAAVRAALAGGAAECDVLVLRRKTAEAAATAGNAMAGAAGVGRGWRSRGGAWTKRFLGSVGRDGTVVLEAVAGPEVEGGEINEGSSLVL